MRTNRFGLVAPAVCIGFLLMLVLAGISFRDAQAEAVFDCPNGPLAAQLTGSAISEVTPAGTARFREKGSNQLIVNVRSVNVPANTALDVYIGDTKVGTITIGNGRSGQLRVDSTATIEENTAITVRNGTTTILSGTFGCVAGGPGSNSNTNSNTNMNTNLNTNVNMNMNTNVNVNTNVNINTNVNTNVNTNTNASPSPKL